MLDLNGHRVTIIDLHSSSFRRLPDDFGGDTVIGTGIDEDVLRVANIETADSFIALSENDNRNIMAAQVARTIFDVPQVIIRIYDPVREDTYRRMGYATVCPTTTISALVLDQVASSPESDPFTTPEEV
jgi:trk system potassium uptake protein TrkA